MNDQPIHSMQDLQDAFQAPINGFHLFKFSNDRVEALEAENAARINRELMEAYQIPAPSRMHAHE